MLARAREKEWVSAQEQKRHLDFGLRASHVSETLVTDDRYISMKLQWEAVWIRKSGSTALKRAQVRPGGDKATACKSWGGAGKELQEGNIIQLHQRLC